MIESQKRGKNAPKWTPEEEAQMGLYLNAEGEVVMPGMNLLASMRRAATNFRVGGKGKKTFKDLVMSGLETVPEEPLLIGNWVVDLRPVVINRARVLKARPRFDAWACEFQIKVIDPVFLDVNHGGSIVEEILSYAGTRIGLGDFRPERGGPYGRFAVTKVDEVKPAP